MDVMRMLDELRILSQNGLRYADNPYDEDRYERILTLVSEYYGKSLDIPADVVKHQFATELGHITPKVGAEAGIFEVDGRILLVRRADDGQWCLPCGWVEPNESPAETAVRETREETGLEVHPVELVGVFHRPPGRRFGPHGEIAIVYLCETEGGALTPSHEAEELKYWQIADVPEWHKRHETYARKSREAWDRMR